VVLGISGQKPKQEGFLFLCAWAFYIANSRFALTVFAAVAQLEREHILQRQAEGIAAANARGVHLDRPIKKPPANFTEVVKLWERGEITFSEALKRTGLRQAAFYNRLRG